MFRRNRNRSENVPEDTTIIPPGGRKEVPDGAPEERQAPHDVERYVDVNVGGRLRYPSQDITTGARLGTGI